MKKCPRCKTEKPISAFGKNRSKKDGLKVYCRECVNDYQRNHRNIEYEQQYRKQRKKERIRKASEKYRLTHPRRVWARQTLGQHKRKGIKVNITRKELEKIIKQINNCQYCNIKLDWSFGNKGRTINNSPSLDRINNENFIDSSNIMIVCHKCNTTKQDRTLEEFIQYCKNIVQKFR